MTVESNVKNHVVQASVYSVSELNQAVSDLLGSEFGLVWLRGEVSSFTRASSGHFYFSLKDDQAVVRAVMFRGRQAYCAFMPAVGDVVEVQARVGLYEPRGEFQINIQALRRAGRGSLNDQFELLKAKLKAEGLFELAGKRQVTPMPRAIGVITSLGAAALHDVLTTLARRAPHVPVIVYPTLVQGQSAPLSLRQALAKANERQEVDTILLVRGGGSMEDLWAFNDESLARDIAASVIPVIAGVGHESDTTIADFVADLRAPTPTAAAELCCAARVDLQELVASRIGMLTDRISRKLERLAQRVDRLGIKLVSPSERIAARGHQLALLSQRLRYAAPDVARASQRAQQARDRLVLAWQQRANAWSRQLERLTAMLNGLSPMAPLARGFAIVRSSDGRIVTDAQTLAVNDRLVIDFARGSANATVDEVLLDPETRLPVQD
ncbi:MAG: exodeoxyribonuclease VII large subunit [Burkholderiaceae bacterium]|nr:exodeoxyribonuclease VII large subunit [Burkholderiaceae bacterium]MCD8516722.1 exodeoxyribonuclease VII large subunit [Burkholderiaceae bacterium]MCD8565160.1 exodeoxyribonuclease VII large subunit [Burkholderiaceae bacterium]